MTKEEQYQMQFSMLSHEIRNPTALLNSYLQLTEQLYPQVETFATWSKITESMTMLRKMLDDLSDLNHAGMLQTEDVSLSWFLNDLVTSCRPGLAPISITYQKSGPLPVCRIDPLRMRCALLNLIRNAAEALSEFDSIDYEKKIWITSTWVNGLFRIEISDNGPEIPADQIPTLFDLFVTHKPNGSGMGLTIVKKTVLAHRGTVFVRSSSSATTFSILFPGT